MSHGWSWREIFIAIWRKYHGLKPCIFTSIGYTHGETIYVAKKLLSQMNKNKFDIFKKNNHYVDSQTEEPLWNVNRWSLMY